MSVQLILYPQSYNGQFNSIATTSNELVVDGLFFNSINTSGSYDTSSAANAIVDVLTNAAPSVVNTWYRYRSTFLGTPTLPTEVSGNLTLYSVDTTLSGVYQKLSNLVSGTAYEIVIDLSTTGSGWVFMHIYNGTTVVSQSYLAATQSQITHTWNAQNTNETIVISYYNTTTDNIVINSISVLDQGPTPTTIFTDLQDGQVICDLYEDEDIPLTLSIDDFKNVAEKVQSYSKAFNLPATKRNNLIFDNIFEVTRTDTGLNFNPYKKTQCVLKQNGFILFEGYLRLIDIQDKEGEISYNVNLYSEVVALKDVLGNKSFSDISFVELEHDYHKTNITRSWKDGGTGPTFLNANVSGFRDANDTLKYPFVDWNHQFTFDASNFPVLPNLETAFRPWISIKYLIDRIFDESPFTYESDFFNGSDFDFDKLYMDFNWGQDDNPNSVSTSGQGNINRFSSPYWVGTTWENIPFVSQTDFDTSFGWDDATDSFICPTGQTNTTYDLYAHVDTYNPLSSTVQFRWLYTPDGGTPVPISAASIIKTGSAVITFQASLSAFSPTGVIISVDVVLGGYYTSTPTLTVELGFMNNGSGAILTAVGPFPGPITDVTIVDGGNNYDDGVLGDSIWVNGQDPSHCKIAYGIGVTQVMNPNDTLEFQWKSDIASSSMINVLSVPNPQHVKQYGTYPFKISGSVSITGVIKSAIFQGLRGDLKQWDFLKGIFTMFNLVTLPDPDNPANILIEPYSDVFINNTASGTTSDLSLASRGIAHDWTDKIDVSEMKLTPLTDLNKKTIFKFVEDDDDYAFNVYKSSVGGHLYGSKLQNETFYTALEGEKEIVAEPFAATVPKPLMTQFPDLIIPAIYSYKAEDQTTEGFENSPRIMYNNGIKTLSSCTYYIPAQNGVTSSNKDEYLQFSHLSDVPSVSASTVDFHFGQCQYMPGLGATVLNNLFNTYWSPYYNQLYNPNTRTMTIKVNLSPADINTFNFFDTVMIKNREFRVNKIDYKPNDLAKVEFILIT